MGIYKCKQCHYKFEAKVEELVLCKECGVIAIMLEGKNSKKEIDHRKINGIKNNG